MSNKRPDAFTDIFCKLTLIPKGKIESYLKTGTIGALIEHPQSLDITKNQLEKIEMLRDIYKFYDRTSAMKHFDISNSQTVANYLRSHFPSLYDKEHMVVGFLDKNYRILGAEVISTGTLNASIVHPRDVFREAIKYGSSKILLSHNHPSGDVVPSHEDIGITYRLEEVGKALNIELLDHIIVGPSNKYFSFKDENLIDFRFIPDISKKAKEYNPQEVKEYRKSINHKVELLNKITKIPKTKLKNLIEDSIESIHNVFKNPEKYNLTPEEVAIIKDLDTLRIESYEHQNNYHDNKFKISSPQHIRNLLDKNLNTLESYKGVALLDTKNCVIDTVLLNKNMSTKDALKEILKTAINYDSNSVIIFQKDKEVDLINNEIVLESLRVKEKCELVGINLLDSIVIDKNNKTISLKQEALLNDSNYKDKSKFVNKQTIKEISKSIEHKSTPYININSPKKNLSLEKL